MNALGPRPILLRVGAQAYQARLAEYMLALLSSTTTASEHEDFNEAKATHERLISEYRRINEETGRLIELRNNVDRLEQAAEDARRRLTPELFAASIAFDISNFRSAHASLAMVFKRVDRSRAGAFVSLLWPLFRGRRLQALAASMQAHREPLAQIGIYLSDRGYACFGR